MESDGGQGVDLWCAGGADFGSEAERNRTESKGFHSEVGKKSGTAKNLIMTAVYALELLIGKVFKLASKRQIRA